MICFSWEGWSAQASYPVYSGTVINSHRQFGYSVFCVKFWAVTDELLDQIQNSCKDLAIQFFQDFCTGVIRNQKSSKRDAFQNIPFIKGMLAREYEFVILYWNYFSLSSSIYIQFKQNNCQIPTQLVNMLKVLCYSGDIN